YGGLKAARNFAVCFGDRERAEQYNKAAEEIRAGAQKYLYNEKLGRFVRRLVARESADDQSSPYDVDEVIDASLYAIYKFHLFEADDPRVEATMRAVEEKLWVKTRVGGVARYENDYYHRISADTASVPGNPWYVCSLWLAGYLITRASTPAELKMALPGACGGAESEHVRSAGGGVRCAGVAGDGECDREIREGRSAESQAAEGDAVDRHPRLHRVRCVRGALLSRCVADDRWQGDGG